MCATAPETARGHVDAQQMQNLQELTVTYMMYLVATRVGHKDAQAARWLHDVLFAKCHYLRLHLKSAGCLSD